MSVVDLAEDSFDPSFDNNDANANNEANDDFDFLQDQISDDADYWISEEQAAEMAAGDGTYPSASDWKEDPPAIVEKTVVTIDSARRRMFDQFKTEASIIRRSWTKDHPSFSELAEKIYGQESEMFRLFKVELGMSYEQFCRFLATFYSVSRLSANASMLLDDERYISDGFMTKEDYEQTLKLIEGSSNGDDDDSLWMQLEEKFNSFTKKDFMAYRGSEFLSIALDDDKKHFSYSKNSKTYGLKKCRHIKDNRFGHTAHTAGLSASGIPLAAKFEREEETSTQVYIHICKKLFGTRTGNADPNLQNLIFCSDRGYWTPALLFNFLLKNGADVVGTVMRCFWYPFTFTKGRKKNNSDDNEGDTYGRIEIPMKGQKNVFYRSLKWGCNNIRAVCYRSGTGTAVSLAMSTRHHSPYFDMNLSFPKDNQWYFDNSCTQEDRNEKAFPVVAGNNCYSTIKEHPIKPLTIAQGDTAWFIMRQFSLSSSTVDRCISSRAREISPSHPMRKHYDRVLAAVGRTNLLAQEESEEENEQEYNNDTARRDSENIDGEPIGSDDENTQAPVPFNPATNWIRHVNEDDNGVNNFIRGLDDGSITEAVQRNILQEHDNSNPQLNKKAMKEKLSKWAQLESSLHRQYYFYSVPQLKTRIKELDGMADCKKLNKPQLLDLVVQCERKRRSRNTLLQNEEDPYEDDGEVDPILLDVIKSSFLKPLGEEAKKYCREGQALERPFLKEFHRHCLNDNINTCGYESMAIHETPNVEATSCKGVTDSSDAEFVYSKQGEGSTDGDSDGDSGTDGNTTVKLMPIEIKARVTHSTFHTERNQLEVNVEAKKGYYAYEDVKPIYVEIDAEEGELHKWIPKRKESFQLMHHVAARDVRKGLFLVGNKKNIMFGVFVTYSDELIESYKQILDDLYRRAFAPFYEDGLTHEMKTKIENVIKTKEMKKLGISLDSFLTAFYIWRSLRFTTTLELPIPPCNRILPLNHSYWNNMKGASDTITKLMWLCQVKFANRGSSQLVASATFLQLFSIYLHRSVQIAQARTDLNFYASLYHFRNTSNRHQPYHKTLKQLSDWLIAKAGQADHGNSNDASSSMNENDSSFLRRPTQVPSSPARIARDNPSRPFEEDRNYTYITGGTPCRGRPKFPKNKTIGWHNDQDRLKNCKGDIYMLNQTNSSSCYLCKSKTKFFCVGCKRPYCLGGNDTKVMNLICDNAEEVSMLNGVRPAATYRINQVAADNSTTHLCTVINSCYHIQHKATRQALSRIQENINKE